MSDKRELDENEHFVINGELSIKELYELAKQGGFENRYLFFSVKNEKTGQYFSTVTVKTFGKGWSKNSVRMSLTWEDSEDTDCSPG